MHWCYLYAIRGRSMWSLAEHLCDVHRLCLSIPNFACQGGSSKTNDCQTLYPSDCKDRAVCICYQSLPYDGIQVTFFFAMQPKNLFIILDHLHQRIPWSGERMSDNVCYHALPWRRRLDGPLQCWNLVAMIGEKDKRTTKRPQLNE